MKDQLTATALALQYGREAAEKGLEFHPMYDTRFEELLTVATCDEQRTVNSALIQSWQSGYSEYCRSLRPGSSDTHEIIMVDHTVLRGASPTAGLVYWDWMDNLSVCAVFCETEAGHWSLFQEETYLQRHWEQQEEYSKIKNTFKYSKSQFIEDLCQLLAQEKSFDLSVPVQPPILICEREGLTEKIRCAGLQYWSYIHSLSAMALHAEWKAQHLTWYQACCYSARHPEKTEAFNIIYNRDYSEEGAGK
jgi:hypothetical protein